MTQASTNREPFVLPLNAGTYWMCSCGQSKNAPYLLGYKTRLGAAALIIFLIPATLIFHTNLADPIQQIMFLKNLGLLGSLLLVLQHGPGRISLDRTH